MVLLFLRQTQKCKGKSLLSLQKKRETFACVIFSEICHVACEINRAGKLICLHTCLHECDHVRLIDKPANMDQIGS